MALKIPLSTAAVITAYSQVRAVYVKGREVFHALMHHKFFSSLVNFSKCVSKDINNK